MPKRHVILLCPDTSSSLENEWSDYEKDEFQKLCAGIEALPDTRLTLRRDHLTFFAELLQRRAEIEKRKAAGQPPVEEDEEMVVFNLLQEGVFNDPAYESHVCALLDIAGVAYTGSGVAAIISSLDKSLMATIARDRGIRVPESTLISVGDDVAARLRADPPTRYPVLVKLSNAYSSLGMDEDPLCADLEETIAKATSLRARFPAFGVLAQEYLPGREFSVAIVGNECTGALRVFPILELNFAGLKGAGKVPVQSHAQRLDNDSELNKGGTIMVTEEVLPRETIEAVSNCASTMFTAVGARDYARFDVRMGADNTVPYMIDANPNCWVGGKFVQMAGWGGLSLSQLLGTIIDEASARHKLSKAEKEAEKAK